MPVINWVLVPQIPQEGQWGGLARDIMMWMDMDYRKTPRTLLKHLQMSGAVIPEWFKEEKELENLDSVISKGTRVTLIYRAMIEDSRLIEPPTFLT